MLLFCRKWLKRKERQPKSLWSPKWIFSLCQQEHIWTWLLFLFCSKGCLPWPKIGKELFDSSITAMISCNFLLNGWTEELCRRKKRMYDLIKLLWNIWLTACFYQWRQQKVHIWTEENLAVVLNNKRVYINKEPWLQIQGRRSQYTYTKPGC